MDKKKSSKNIIKRIFSYFYKYRVSVVIVIVFTILESLVTVISPKVAGNSITILSETDSFGNPNVNMSNFYNLLAILLVLYSIESFCSCIGKYIFTNISTSIVYDFRNEISQKIHKLSFKYLDSKTRGEILSYIINDVEVLSFSFIDNIKDLIFSLIVSIGTIYMMFSISWQMTLLCFCFVPLIIILISIIIKHSQKYFIGYRDKLSKMNELIEECFSGYETIKTFGIEKNFLNKFDDVNVALYKDLFNSSFVSRLTPSIIEFISKIIYVVCCAFGGYLSVVNGMEIGNIVSFMTYSNQFINPFMTLSGISGNFQNCFAAATRIFEFLDAPEESTYDNITNEYLSNSYNSEIDFKNVNFSYDERNKAISNFSFKIKPGQTVAIVGETGSGKTTLMKLIMHFYDVDSGEILINGQNINDFDIDNYREKFSVVTQDSWLYNSSILENIRYGNLEASDEKVKEVAAFVGIENFIESLPNGYNTIIEEMGSNLSEGQKQLICIARAVLSDCEVFIMDEATASVDTFTESCLQKSLSKILSNKTSIIIAHRLSTIKNADVILVLKDGKLIESGTYSELIKNQKIFFELYKNSK